VVFENVVHQRFGGLGTHVVAGGVAGGKLETQEQQVSGNLAMDTD
jgi:hypothetical protein